MREETKTLEVARKEGEIVEEKKRVVEVERQREEERVRREEERLKEVQRKGEEEEAVVAANKEKAAAEVKKKVEYVGVAEGYVTELRGEREGLMFFDKCKERSVSKRRLGMKKIAKGKLNTLSLNEGKIRDVAREVVGAIRACAADDDAVRNQIERGGGGDGSLSLDMAKGEEYLIDLIASTVTVRVQADGFNG